MAKLVVTINDREYPLGVEETLRFGRATRDGVIGVDPDGQDESVSRKCGRIAPLRGWWQLINISETRPLIVEYRKRWGIARVPLGPGDPHVFTGPATILVRGKAQMYPVSISGPDLLEGSFPVPAPDPPGQDDDLPPTAYAKFEYRVPDLVALLAMFEGYLLVFPRHEPYPCSYATAAAKLGWTKKALERRIEKLREALNEAGELYSAGGDALRSLADYVLSTGVISPADLPLLEQWRDNGDTNRSTRQRSVSGPRIADAD